jgi:helix-turn-helix protein
VFLVLPSREPRLARLRAANSSYIHFGLGEHVNHKRVGRLMRAAGIQGPYRRHFTVDQPDRL